MPRAAQFKVRGLAPADLADHPVAVRRQFWQWVAELVTQRKVEEMTAGLDKNGNPLRPISAKTRKYRRSAMTPTGRGDPLAPPLIPGWHKSRTISLFAARAYDDHVACYWRFDAFTGDSWGVVLEYQKKQGRDTIGLSPSGLRWVEAQALARWRRWTDRTGVPVPTRPPVNPTRSPVAKVAVAPTRPKPTRPTSPGPRRWPEWAEYFRQPARVEVPGRPAPASPPHPTTGPEHNRILEHVWETAPAKRVIEAAQETTPQPQRQRKGWVRRILGGIVSGLRKVFGR